MLYSRWISALLLTYLSCVVTLTHGSKNSRLFNLLQSADSTGPNNVEYAICTLTTPSSSGISGTIKFYQSLNGGALVATGNITGLPVGQHGWHVHQFGDLSNGCLSAGEHWNPYNASHHGGPYDTTRHIGDFGNLNVTQAGRPYTFTYTDPSNYPRLYGPFNIVGHAIVIHANVDDLGRGNSSLSLTTGNSGGRIACGVIGYEAVQTTSS